MISSLVPVSQWVPSLLHPVPTSCIACTNILYQSLLHPACSHIILYHQPVSHVLDHPVCFVYKQSLYVSNQVEH